MSIKRSLALNVAPLSLRLALGATFLWAGFGKIAHPTIIDNPQDQALLVEWGQIDPLPSAIPNPQPDPVDAQPEVEPTPTPDPEAVPAQAPETTPPPVIDDPAPTDDEIVVPEPKPEADPQETDEPATDPSPVDDTAPADDATTPPESNPPEEAEPTDDPGILPVSYAQAPGTVEVKRVLGLALMLHHAANPGVDDQGKALMPLWPAALDKGSIPVVVAWVVSILELVCGAALLAGFFTRLASIPLIGAMLVAIWLTQVGPAIQGGDAVLGFLPQGVFDVNDAGYAYATLLWQFGLGMMAFAMMLIGPGFFSIDRLIFGASSSSKDFGDNRQVEFVPMGE